MPETPILRLGTRNSALARWQAEWVAENLTAHGFRVELVPISTTGDRQSAPLSQFGGTGVFTKELQQALLDDRIDLAVHSLKDLPTQAVPGLRLAAVPERESALDALITNVAGTLAELPDGARIGTGSARRRAQLLHLRPDLDVSDVRGNVDTRLKKLDEGQFDALILAVAGMRRLGWSDRITQELPLDVMLPAVGQGALGIETCADDDVTQSAVSVLDDPATHACVSAERALLSELVAGCLAPVGAIARIADSQQLELKAVVFSTDGSRRLKTRQVGEMTADRELGRMAAQDLLTQGAGELIAASR